MKHVKNAQGELIDLEAVINYQIMKTELELSDILPYYEHDLVVKVNDGFALLNGIAGKTLISIAEINAVDAGMYVSLKDIKPCLRPIGDLININPVTGNKFFIDIIGASCEMPFQGKNGKFWQTIFSGNKHLTENNSEAEYLDIDNKFNEYSFGIDLANGDLNTYRNDELATTDNQANYIAALNTYHFDYKQLIKSGLAIDKKFLQFYNH